MLEEMKNPEIEELDEQDERDYEAFKEEYENFLRQFLTYGKAVSEMKPEEVTMKDKTTLGDGVFSLVETLKEMYPGTLSSEEDENDAKVLVEEMIVFMSHLYQRLSSNMINELEEFRMGVSVS